MSLVQVIPLGGAGEIGKNCTVVRQGDDLIVIDCGLSFPHEEQYGVDIVIPDLTFLEQNADKIKGLFLTHAHEDHIGAIPQIAHALKMPIYCSAFCEAMLRSKLQEKAKDAELDIRRFKPGDVIQAGSMTVEPVLVTHSIPETCAMAVRTAHGIILFTADFKLDFSPVDKRLTNIKRLAELGDEGVLVLLSDSTNVERKGWGPSESVVGPALRQIFTDAPGRVLLTTFSSNIHRMQQAINAAKDTGRKVAVAGRRMDMTVNMCKQLNYLTIPDSVYIRLDEARDFPPNQLVILVTGSQGEPSAALSQMSRGEYSRLKVQEGDTILYSARPIPGNEGGIYRTVNRLVERGARVMMDHAMPIHVSGHAYQDELRMMISLTKPFYLAPVHGEPRHQAMYVDMSRAMGHAEHRMFTLLNGQTLCVDDQKAWIGETVPHGEILIDQNGGYEVTDDLLRERYQLAHNGVVVVTAHVDAADKSLRGKPSLTASGYCGDLSDLDEARDVLAKELRSLQPAEIMDRATLSDFLSEPVRRVLGRVSKQKPMVIPVIVGLPD